MPAKTPKIKPISINLVPKDPFYNSLIGRILTWAMTAGRYLVIFTELIVIISFATRFKLDRDVTDLNTSLHQKKIIIESYGPLESNVRQTQAKIEQYNQVETSGNIVDVFAYLTEVTPTDVVLDKLVINPTSVVVSGKTLSQVAFNTLINNLQLSPHFQNITVSKVEASQESSGLDFQLQANTKDTNATTKPAKAPTKSPASNKENEELL